MSDVRIAFPNPCDEHWETMTPTGCHRTCAKCDKVIHDLSQYDVIGVEKLLRDEPESCVRARIDAFGVVATKPERGASVRRLVAVVGASAGLLISPPLLAQERRAAGAIAGTAEIFPGSKTTVVAKDEGGNLYRAKVGSNGRYKIKNVPAGTYTVEFYSECGASWVVKDVIVRDEKVNVAGEPSDDERCIIIGLISFDEAQG